MKRKFIIPPLPTTDFLDDFDVDGYRIKYIIRRGAKVTCYYESR